MGGVDAERVNKTSFQSLGNVVSGVQEDCTRNNLKKIESSDSNARLQRVG